MFAKNARDSDDSKQPRRGQMVRGHGQEERRVAAWIGASIVIKGNLTSLEDMTIAGQIEGDVIAKEHMVVVAPRARIRGNIVARSVAVHGAVLGTITAERIVEVGETGSVDGDIVSPRMAVAEGAALHGRLGIALPSSGKV
ncbi:MAG: polymer-forming cytoskeletal protein [Gemmatimonadota bacterium]|jgi:cytoskeletal protein CcmA (bactofilin family)